MIVNSIIEYLTSKKVHARFYPNLNDFNVYLYAYGEELYLFSFTLKHLVCPETYYSLVLDISDPGFLAKLDELIETEKRKFPSCYLK